MTMTTIKADEDWLFYVFDDMSAFHEQLMEQINSVDDSINSDFLKSSKLVLSKEIATVAKEFGGTWEQQGEDILITFPDSSNAVLFKFKVLDLFPK